MASIGLYHIVLCPHYVLFVIHYVCIIFDYPKVQNHLNSSKVNLCVSYPTRSGCRENMVHLTPSCLRMSKTFFDTEICLLSQTLICHNPFSRRNLVCTTLILHKTQGFQAFKLHALEPTSKLNTFLRIHAHLCFTLEQYFYVTCWVFGLEAWKKEEERKITPVSKYQHECEPVSLVLIVVFQDAT